MAGSHGLQLDPIATSEHHSTHARHCDAAESPVPPFKNVRAPSIDREGLVVAAPARVVELTRDDGWVVVADFAVKRGGAAAGLEAYLAVPLVEYAIATFIIFVPPDVADVGRQECRPPEWNDLEARGNCISGHGKSVAEQCELSTQCELNGYVLLDDDDDEDDGCLICNLRWLLCNLRM